MMPRLAVYEKVLRGRGRQPASLELDGRPSSCTKHSKSTGHLYMEDPKGSSYMITPKVHI